MKNVLCSILCVVCIVTVCISDTLAQESSNNKELTVACVSNLSDLSSINVLSHDGALYIKASDAAALSGYALIGEYQHCTYVRSGHQITSEKGLKHQSVRWVPMESTLSLLQTEIQALESCLIFRGKEYIAEELIAASRIIMFVENNRYRITDTDGSVGNLGCLGAAIYGIASQGNLFSRISGNYSETLYENVFLGLVGDGSDDILLNTVGETGSLMQKLGTIAKYEIAAAEETDELLKMTSRLPVCDEAVAISILSDPVGQLFKRTGIGEAISLKGLTLDSQFHLYQYFDALISCSTVYSNMITYTYSSDAIISMPQYLPSTAKTPVHDIIRYYNSTEYTDLLLRYLEAEGETIFEKSVDGFLDTLLSDILFGSAAGAVPAVQLALRESYDMLFNNISEKMSFIEQSRCLSLLQVGIMKLYSVYIKDPSTAINAKYAAMLYLRCNQYNYELATASGVIDKSVVIERLYSKPLVELAAFNDHDLTAVVRNEAVSLELLEALPAEAETGNEYSGFTGVWQAKSSNLEPPEYELIIDNTDGQIDFRLAFYRVASYDAQTAYYLPAQKDATAYFETVENQYSDAMISGTLTFLDNHTIRLDITASDALIEPGTVIVFERRVKQSAFFGASDPAWGSDYTDTDMKPLNLNWWHKTTEEKIWACAALLEKLLRENDQVWDFQVLSSGNAEMVESALEWNLYQAYDECLRVNDIWITDKLSVNILHRSYCLYKDY